MKTGLTTIAICSALSCAIPAMAQTPSAPQALAPIAKAESKDADFLTGLKRLGVLVGQSVECQPEAERQAEIEKVANIGTEIAVEYGLRASFNFIGAAGYGAGKPFEKTECAEALKEWKTVQEKYGEK